MPEQASGGIASMTVWIERADGTVVRGGVKTVSTRGARVLLPGRHAFRPDEPVVLRICFSPERPMVGASAQVKWARPLGDAVDCGLEWDLATAEIGSSPAQPHA
jgi:hypothetical protein